VIGNRPPEPVRALSELRLLWRPAILITVTFCGAACVGLWFSGCSGLIWDHVARAAPVGGSPALQPLVGRGVSVLGPRGHPSVVRALITVLNRAAVLPCACSLRPQRHPFPGDRQARPRPVCEVGRYVGSQESGSPSASMVLAFASFSPRCVLRRSGHVCCLGAAGNQVSQPELHGCCSLRSSPKGRSVCFMRQSGNDHEVSDGPLSLIKRQKRQAPCQNHLAHTAVDITEPGNQSTQCLLPIACRLPGLCRHLGNRSLPPPNPAVVRRTNKRFR